ncbi:MAG: hypothetical protein DME24_11625 [Verrucomicrobia bacterium]|nr:MAG: hypothetical protein DME24_11625 [Verrucomicrobiota bacterium]
MRKSQQRLFVQIVPAAFRLSNDPDANQVREGVLLFSGESTKPLSRAWTNRSRSSKLVNHALSGE